MQQLRQIFGLTWLTKFMLLIDLSSGTLSVTFNAIRSNCTMLTNVYIKYIIKKCHPQKQESMIFKGLKRRSFHYRTLLRQSDC